MLSRHYQVNLKKKQKIVEKLRKSETGKWAESAIQDVGKTKWVKKLRTKWKKETKKNWENVRKEWKKKVRTEMENKVKEESGEKHVRKVWHNKSKK